MRAAIASLLLLLTACSAPPAPEAPAARTVSSRLPQREELPCFPCHSQLKFEKGPPFAHASAAHRQHCHACHVGSGHEPREIDKQACLSCHDEQSAELSVLAKADPKSK